MYQQPEMLETKCTDLKITTDFQNKIVKEKDDKKINLPKQMNDIEKEVESQWSRTETLQTQAVMHKSKNALKQ